MENKIIYSGSERGAYVFPSFIFGVITRLWPDRKFVSCDMRDPNREFSCEVLLPSENITIRYGGQRGGQTEVSLRGERERVAKIADILIDEHARALREMELARKSDSICPRQSEE